MGGGVRSQIRTILQEIPLYFDEKFKIERQNEGRGDFFPSFPGFNRMGKQFCFSREQADNRRLTGDEQVHNRTCIIAARATAACGREGRGPILNLTLIVCR